MSTGKPDIKILLVEDELIIAEHISNELQKYGFIILEILTRGEDALEFLAKIKPDLIIMDIQLSGQLNGIETAKIILDTCNIPVIFLTANIDDATFEKSRLAAPYAFIGKPFKSKELVRTIWIVMGRISQANGVSSFKRS